MRSLLGEISSEMPVAYVGTGISLEISPADSRQQLTLSLCLGNKAVKYQFLILKPQKMQIGFKNILLSFNKSQLLQIAMKTIDQVCTKFIKK